jgi:hypothetical protein
MYHYKKILVALSLISFMIIGMAATRPSDDKKPKLNLKVLPKNISHEELGKIMGAWKDALGVKCGFCHAPSADSSSHKLDFASDAKPEKDIARHMYRMTGKINKKYFSFEKDDKGAMIAAVSCMTCHRGSPHPETAKTE